MTLRACGKFISGIKVEERRYYICHLKLNQCNFYLIWYSDEKDGIVLGEDNNLLGFTNQKLLRSFAEKKIIKIEDEDIAYYNLNVIQEWLRNPTSKIDCSAFLGTWNLLTDVSNSLKTEFKGKKRSWVRNLVYDKLFFGNNLVSCSLNPNGKKYFPKWSLVEIAVLSSILKDGLQLLKRNLT